MSTQQALTVIGYAVGYAFGYPQLGAFVGSMVGSAIDPVKIDGPRLSDLTVSVSRYGAAIPQAFGSVRLPCSPIWAAPLEEREESDDGKGGPVVTSYKYFGWFAVAISEGPIYGVRRCWLDASLVYDVSDPENLTAQAASQRFQQYFTYYAGTETQLPDPTIESFEGAGNVEAYRGTAYIVFRGLPLAEWGNRIPQVRVETSDALQGITTNVRGPYVVTPWVIAGDGTPGQFGGEVEFDQIAHAGKVTDPLGTVSVSGTYSNLYSLVEDFAGPGWEIAKVAGKAVWFSSANHLPNVFEGGADYDEADPEYIYVVFSRGPIRNVSHGLYGSPGTPNFKVALVAEGILPEDPANYGAETSATLMREAWNSSVNSFQRAGVVRLVQSALVAPVPVPWDDIIEYATNSTPSGGYYPAVVTSGLLFVRAKRIPHLPAATCLAGDPSLLGIAELPGYPSICIDTYGSLSPNVVYEEEVGTFRQLAAIQYSGGDLSELTQNALGPVLESTHEAYSSEEFWVAAAIEAGIPHASFGVDYAIEVAHVGLGHNTANTADSNSADLGEIVSTLSQQGGLLPEQLDVTALTGTAVRGYWRSSVMTVRSALEPLRRAFYFDAVESGDVIRFVKRGGDVVATITADELGAAEDASAELVPSDRMQETELPRSVVVAYSAKAADYQTGTQQAQRRVGVSLQEVQVELPIVLLDDEAAAIAAALLYEAHSTRTKRTIALDNSRKVLEPTDVIEVEDDEFVYRLRIMDKSESGGMNTLQCVDDDASTYTRPETGADIPGGSTLEFVGPVLLVPMDAPLLRDVDDAQPAGHYMAAASYTTTWHGAQAFRSTDGTTYSAISAVPARAVIGSATTVLGNWLGGNVFDEANTVTVRLLAGGSLSSATTDEVLSGANAAYLGGEIVQFRSATLVDTLTYRLSGLLRGRLGSEQAMATHAEGERFVLLSARTLVRQSATVDLINLPIKLKGVARGGAIDDAYEVMFTNTGNSAMPLSPAHLAAARQSGGAYLATWVRRSRMSPSWSDNTDVPLGEASESYRLRVLDGDTVVEEKTVTSQSAEFGFEFTGYHWGDPASITLAENASFLSKVGAYSFGVILDGAQYKVVKYDADGLRIAESGDIGTGIVAVTHAAGSMYVLSYDETASPIGRVIRRFEYSNITTAAAESALDAADPLSSIAYCYGALWAYRATAAPGGSLERLNADTLAVDSSLTLVDAESYGRVTKAGNWLCVITGHRLLRISSAGAIVGQTQNIIAYNVVGSGDTLVLLSFSTFAGRLIEVLDVGAARGVPPLQEFGYQAAPGFSVYVQDSTILPILVVGDVFLYPQSNSSYYEFDMTREVAASNSGNELPLAFINVAQTPVGQSDDGVYFFNGSATEFYTFSETSPPVDHTGRTLEVCQLSAVVGPGWPATITL